MKSKIPLKQRAYASLFLVGAGILLMRTIILLSQKALVAMVGWVATLLFIEFILDLGWLIASMRWWALNENKWMSITLRLAATAIILHAIRVLIFVLGRIGPWIDFDYRPEYLPLSYSDWGWLYFALVISILGVIGVVVVWLVRRKLKT